MRILAMCVLMFFVSSVEVMGQWSSDPGINTPVCTASGLQQTPRIINDGNGGTIIVWQDFRSGNYDIYAQRLSDAGVAQWTANGIALTNVTIEDSYPEITTDGSGGAIVIWGRNNGIAGNLYAQRINSNGVSQWQTNGVLINDIDFSVLSNYRIAPDGYGGAIIVWEQYGYDTNRVHVQRINSVGALLWGNNGVQLTTQFASSYTAIIGDGNGGAFAAFQTGSGEYLQKLDSSGARLWGTYGVPASASSISNNSAALIADGIGGIIVSFVDSRNGNADIYAQRLNASGQHQWNINDIPICNAAGSQYYPGLVTDGASGAIIIWGDYRNAYQSVYLQRVNAAGTVQWAANGINVSGTASTSSWTMASDGTGGAVAVWSDYRVSLSNCNMYAQRIDAAGAVQWTAGGAALCTAPHNQNLPTMVSDNVGNAVIAFEDERNGGVGFNIDTYAQRIGRDGTLGGPASVSEGPQPSSFSLEQNYPNPFNPSTLIRYTIAGNGENGVGSKEVRLVVYDLLGRKVAVLVNEKKAPGSYEARFDASGLSTGVYIYRLTSGQYVESHKMVLMK